MLMYIGLIRDPLLAHKEHRMSTTWTDEEKQIFCEKSVYSFEYTCAIST